MEISAYLRISVLSGIIFIFSFFFCILIDDFQSEEPMAGEKLFLKVDG